MKGIIAIWLLVACVVVEGRMLVEECPANQTIDWEIEMLLRHEDCNKFYKCTFGKPIEYKCYGNLYFNLETWQCDWPENVDCTDRNIPDEDTTTVEPTTTTTTTPVPTTTTTTTTTPAPTTTTTTTTTTTPAPTTTTTTTPVPTTTTTTTPVPTTTTTTTTTPRPTTTSTTTTTTAAPTTTEEPEIEFGPNGCPVDPKVHWLLPHEEDCNSFYYCVWQQKVLRQCPSGLHFNAVLQVCDWRWDAGCEVALNKHLESRQMMRAL